MTDDAPRRQVEAFLAARDEGSFLALYRAHTPFLLLMAQRLLGDAAEAEDAIQETWVRAVRALPGFRWESSLRTWLASIAINCAREALRRRGPGTEGEPYLLDPPTPSPSVPGEIEALVRRLPDGYREVLVLHDIEGYTHEEIALQMGIRPGTSKSQLSRARRLLRTWLDSRETTTERSRHVRHD